MMTIRTIFALFMLLASSAYGAAPTTGLVGYWKFDETSGITASDSSGNNLPGTLVNNPDWTAGKVNNALNFNGSSYVDLANPTALRLTGSMTISAWVMATSTPVDDGQIVAKSNDTSGWQFKTSPDTGPHTFAIAVSSGSGHIQRYSATVRSLSTWYHVTGVYNATAGSLDIYVNGALNNGTLNGTVPAAQADSTVNVNIGRRTGNSSFNFFGLIDEVRIYNRALSAQEVLDVYNDLGAPFAPVISSLSATPATITQGMSAILSWSVSGNPVPALSLDNGIGAVTGTSRSVTPLQTTPYTLTATNSQGTTTKQTTITVLPPDTTPPTTPTGLQTTSVYWSQLNLSWTASTDTGGSGLAGYRIYRGGVQVGTSTSNSFTDTGLSASTTYSYTVSAYDASGNVSAPSSPPLSVTTPVQTGPAYPIKASTTGRYLVDQNNVPFFMIGDSPQALTAALSEADVEYYLANREAAGFNAAWVNLLCIKGMGCNSSGTTYDGIPPFTTANNLATPNEAFFARVDRILQLAANHKIVVVLDPIETISWLSTLRSNGVAKARAYGQYLGNRYKNFDNIIWMSGNDFQTWADPTDDALVNAVALGIRDFDTRHLQTVELNYQVSSSIDDPLWASFVGLNAAYTYFATYAELLKDYNTSPIPTFMVEANYEFEGLAGPVTTAYILRKQEYWTVLSGAAGQLYGSAYTWPFPSNWKSNLNTPGAAEIKYLKALFEPRKWYTLVPDQDHTVVTAGFGTFSSTSYVANNDYLTAARTPDGSLIMAYMPTVRTITVDMTKLAGRVDARWYDPTNGTYTTISGSPFANTGTRQFAPTGNNSGGAGDWILVLEVASSPILYGDVSENGTVTAYDASLAAQYAVGSISLTSSQITKADVSCNGSVTAYDASLIAQYAVGLIITLGCG